jgi:hypothetical protein
MLRATLGCRLMNLPAPSLPAFGEPKVPDRTAAAGGYGRKGHGFNSGA